MLSTCEAFSGVARRGQRRAGRKVGWGPLKPSDLIAYQTVEQGPRQRELTIGRVVANYQQPIPYDSKVVVVPYSARWEGTALVHKPLYLSPEGERVEEGDASTGPATETVSYAAIVWFVSRLLASGELPGEDRRALASGGWKLNLTCSEKDTIRMIREASSV